MNVIRPISDAEVDLHFLQAEFESSRYSGALQRDMMIRNVGRDMLEQPDLTNTMHNSVRKALLHHVTRHDGPVGLYDGFPTDVQWVIAEPTEEEILESKYVNLPNWTWFSRGTRRLIDGAKTVVEYQGSLGNIPQALFWEMAQKQANGGKITMPILVGNDMTRVIADGHLRLTAWAVLHVAHRPHRPAPPRIIFGTSGNLATWSLF